MLINLGTRSEEQKADEYGEEGIGEDYEADRH
jgi:hypothetical protein